MRPRNRRLLTAALAAAAIAPHPAAAAPPNAANSRVAVYLTTADLKQTLARKPDQSFRAGTPSSQDLISVDPTQTYQKLLAGFGVAMTDASAYLLDKDLSAKARAQVMRALFSRVGGIGLSFLRIPIGGSDYVVGQAYTYDDVPAGETDPTLAQFSLGHDYPYIVPMIRKALALNPALSIMANPWTPPAWMKSDDKLVTTTGPLGFLEPRYYGQYAEYLVKFLQGYQTAGIPIDYLGVQNEPLTPLLLVAGIPESYLSPQDEGTLIHDYVSPALKRARLRQKILAFDDHFEFDLAYIPTVMATAASDVAGFAYHCYLSDPSSMSTIHSEYPQQLLLETECSSYLSDIEPAQMAIRVLRNGAQGVQLWNAALNQHYGPKIGNGCKGITGPHAGQDCIAPVIINTNTHGYSFTSDYWALAQFSRFIQLGAERIESTTPSSCTTSPSSGWDCGLEDVAFRNPNGSQVVVATANDGKRHTAVVTEGGRSFKYTVPDGATATFLWPAPRPTITQLRVRRPLRPHRALRVSLSLTEAAQVKATLARTRRRHRSQKIATETLAGVDGRNALTFASRGVRANLTPGRYRLTLIAVDAGGDRGRPLSIVLHVA